MMLPTFLYPGTIIARCCRLRTRFMLMNQRKKYLTLYLACFVLFILSRFNLLNHVTSKVSSLECVYNAMKPWNVRDTDSLSAEEILAYFDWKNHTSCELVHNFGGAVFQEGMRGQKAVCMDPFLRPVRARKCLAYTFGKDLNSAFARDMVRFNCEVYAYGRNPLAEPDVTLTLENKSRSMYHHSPSNLGTENGDHTKTLLEIYRTATDRASLVVDYVNIDLMEPESEWTIIEQILSSEILVVLRQLSITVHLPKDKGIGELRRRAKLIKAIEDRDFIRFNSQYDHQSWGRNEKLGIDGHFSYSLAWYNHRLKRKRAFANLDELEKKKNETKKA